jgi:hypothetical protein
MQQHLSEPQEILIILKLVFRKYCTCLLFSYKVSNLTVPLLKFFVKTKSLAGWLPHFFKSVTSYFSCQLFFMAALPLWGTRLEDNQIGY